jgi:riboflavin kinase
MRILKGRVVSGIGDFSYWMKRLENYYAEKTGLILFPGTLNIELETAYHLPVDALRLEKEEYSGTVSVSIQPCTLFGRQSFILRTDKNASEQGVHGPRIIEVASDIKFRDVYGLKDGDIVEVTVTAG